MHIRCTLISDKAKPRGRRAGVGNQRVILVDVRAVRPDISKPTPIRILGL